MENFADQFLKESVEIISKLDKNAIEHCVDLLCDVKTQGGRLFILGVGGSAASASHAVNDFRKIANIESYAPTDNVSELTARTNDEGWESIFAEWLKGSKLNEKDALLIFSVGGGNAEKNISVNIIKAIEYAKKAGAKVLAVVGRDGGFAAKNSQSAVLIPVVNAQHITPHTESFHGLIWHLIVSHPKLKSVQTKWEKVSK
ncbi:MAG: SIS domain-containing protein [Elusimicrobiota bacterium]|jgi:D-sedoheptulose 7-phosphate isomerase|nr:SIS domain-containing protein [Elusimicrobiota bacterium]